MRPGPATIGSAIRIAVIDSGVNPDHPHVGNVESGIDFCSDPEGKPIRSRDAVDCIGHGTAITGVIHWHAPTAVVCPIRIFQETLEAPASRLLAALEWAIDNAADAHGAAPAIDVIHLSLGLRAERFKQPLLDICRRADRKNILIVAAARATGEPVYPAVFDTVIGVSDLSESHMDDLVYYPDSPVEFGAHPQPRPLPGLPQHLNFRGASFAAAHLTGLAAAILFEEPGASPQDVRHRLVERAMGLSGA